MTDFFSAPAPMGQKMKMNVLSWCENHCHTTDLELVEWLEFNSSFNSSFQVEPLDFTFQAHRNKVCRKIHLNFL